MVLKEISKKYDSHPHFGPVHSLINNAGKERIQLSGLSGSSLSLFASALLERSEKLHLFILNGKDEAAYFYNDLLNCLGEDRVIFFPSSFKRSIQFGQTDNGSIILRANALNKLSDYAEGLLAVVTYPDAIAEKVIRRIRLAEDTLQLQKGEKVSTGFIQEVLETYHFEQVDFVVEPGQFAVRGGIIDIFSFSSEFPYRVNFFGDEVESIRSFDVETQLSKKQFEKISILPNIQEYAQTDAKQSIFEFCTVSPVIWSDSLTLAAGKLNELEEAVTQSDQNSFHTADLFTKKEFLTSLADFTLIEAGTRSLFPDPEKFTFETRPQPLFQKNFNLLAEDLKILNLAGYETLILSDNEKQIERIKDIFKDTKAGVSFDPVYQVVHEGFVDDTLKFSCYTDHQIFDRYHKYHLNQYFSSKASVSLKELKDLKPGDYVVHIDHGIGRFGGLEKNMVNGKVQEVIRLVYRDNDILYVPIHSLHRISKYKGKDDSEPKIYKLGTGAWQKLKQSTKKKVKDIAKDLIALYAKRKTQKGFKFSPDTYLQEELEASFIYEDTPDQEKATTAVKTDMESEIPMDRLICGDVGFGKTEVAIRAAFKAVADSKQVAVLVPTTILALQHNQTFHDRLKDFPCRVEYISRLKSMAVQKKILAETLQGRVDILIGTHRLLGKDIRFKDLGLLIVDEEQKFGVAAKEKLKAIKVNVDTLTMTATPIPRTLQFSLMGARDLSVINTPPPNRHPIVTELHNFNEAIIQEGIIFETERGGQVFFIHNRVQNIYEVEALINRLCPRVKTVVGHGQMEGAKLEQVMIDFMNGDYDVLVATTIVESGLDIPNANTIFINGAQNFGLSDLHQLRGRVGRSNKKAFCYLLAPPLTSVTPEARRRLKAIEEFSDLGSGFSLALQDLDIRGAGNMLGAEQSGFIADIGYETYNRILNEAMHELKEEEFKDLFDSGREKSAEITDRKFVTDCSIDTDMEIHFPDFYISNVAERIRLYRELDAIEDEQALTDFHTALIDRFGLLPQPAEELFMLVRLRWMAQMLGFEKIILKNEKFFGYFISDQDSPFYSSEIFMKILHYVQMQSELFHLKEDSRLILTIDHVAGIHEAHRILEKMKNLSEEVTT